jgi:nucleoside 2-deoxyribosyltransferase
MSDALAFVAMPFAPEFHEVYEAGIRPACELVGIRCERVDEQAFSGTILERICSSIAAANIVIADVTTNNANVLYELGHAHALGKRVILLTRSIDTTPFDIRSYPHVVYGSDVRLLRDALAERITRLLDRPSGFIPQQFPWPALLRRANDLLADGKAHVARLLRDGRMNELIDDMTRLEDAHGALNSAELQISVVDGHRMLLFHDWPPLRGRPARHMGFDQANVYEQIFRHDEGAVAWIDDRSNRNRAPALRMNIALFAIVPAAPLRVVVEAHHEIA